MGNIIGKRVPDRSMEQYGGGNPYSTSPPAAETGGESVKTSGWGSSGTNAVEEGRAQRQEDPTGNANDGAAQSWDDLEPRHKVAVVILGILAFLIFIYSPVALIFTIVNCPDVAIGYAYFGFILLSTILWGASAAQQVGRKRAAVLALIPPIFFSLPSIILALVGFGQDCVFLGVANGLLFFFPALTGSFILITCTLGRGLNEALRDVFVVDVTRSFGNADRGGNNEGQENDDPWGREALYTWRGRN